MKIAFAAIFDLTDVRRGSGTFFSLANEIERQGHVVTRIGPVSLDVPFAARVVNGLHHRLGRRHPLFLDPFVGKRTGMQVAERLRGVEYDVLLTNDMAIAAYTRVRQTRCHLHGSHDHAGTTPNGTCPGCRLGNLSLMSLALCRRTMRQALSRSALAVFPADWSAEAARVYSPSAAIKVIPFGANVDDPGPAIAAGRSWERVSAKGVIDLLFVGKDWVRKGGAVAVDATARLNALGIKATLHVVGAEVPKECGSSHMFASTGCWTSRILRTSKLLRRLFTDADVFILPSSFGRVCHQRGRGGGFRAPDPGL